MVKALGQKRVMGGKGIGIDKFRIELESINLMWSWN